MSTRAAPGRIIAFEGVDGAGKSTVIRKVAEHLRGKGVPVFLPREGKEHLSIPARRIRALARDRTNLALMPMPELLLYAAREAQVLEEHVAPAVADGKTVLLDRAMWTPVVLGSYGRGLPMDRCLAAVRAASAGTDPDVTLIFDVDPRTSRIRKRLEKVQTERQRDGGRKGLTGSELKVRIRDGYLALAERFGFPVFHAERITPEALAQRVIAVLEGGALEEEPDDARPVWDVDPALSFEDGLAQLPDSVRLYFGRRLPQERTFRAGLDLKTSIRSWAADREDPALAAIRRGDSRWAVARLAEVPLGRDDPRPRLAAKHPAEVARALVGVAGAEADRIRDAIADAAPAAVLESLAGRSDGYATALRDRLWSEVDVYAAAISIQGLDDDASWARRDALLEIDPAPVLGTMIGLSGSRCDAVLESFAPMATKAVLRGLTGRTDGFAHRLRREYASAGREVVDTVRGLDDDDSWALREAHAEQWPSTVLWSLAGLPRDDRGDRLIDRCLAAAPTDLFVKRRHYLLRRLQVLETQLARSEAKEFDA